MTNHDELRRLALEGLAYLNPDRRENYADAVLRIDVPKILNGLIVLLDENAELEESERALAKGIVACEAALRDRIAKLRAALITLRHRAGRRLDRLIDEALADDDAAGGLY